jgi:hypothetical protein
VWSCLLLKLTAANGVNNFHPVTGLQLLDGMAAFGNDFFIDFNG